MIHHCIFLPPPLLLSSCCQVTDDEKRALNAQLPHCQIKFPDGELRPLSPLQSGVLAAAAGSAACSAGAVTVVTRLGVHTAARLGARSAVRLGVRSAAGATCGAACPLLGCCMTVGLTAVCVADVANSCRRVGDDDDDEDDAGEAC